MRYTRNEEIMENRKSAQVTNVASIKGSYARIKEIEQRTLDKIRNESLRKIDGIHLG